MTLSELHAQLKTAGIPVAYNVFKDPQTPPYICYIIVDSDNMPADGGVYHRVDNVQIELYTKFKDQTAESELEDALEGFFWQKNEGPLESENVYLVTYQIQI